MRKRQRQVNRYVRAVGSYLPCAGKHKAAADGSAQRGGGLLRRNPGRRPGSPVRDAQQVAAAYVDAMSTQELLAALRRRRQVLTILIAAVLTALLQWVAALCVSLYDYHQAYNGWSETSIIEEPSPYGQ